MLFGEYKHSLDPKKRLFIPAKHREELGETFVVAKCIKKNFLRVYSMSEWAKYIELVKSEIARKDYEKIARILHSTAIQVTPDAQGRIILSPSLIEYAKITKNAYVVGCGEYAEIWSEEEYTATVDNDDLDDIRAMLEAFGL